MCIEYSYIVFSYIYIYIYSLIQAYCINVTGEGE